MTILALEFSSAKRSVAVVRAGAESVSVATASPERSTRAFALIDEALRSAKVDRSQIECIAVGTGPGSYTGIRVAISIAQGWQLATAVKLLGISSADAIAGQARAQGITGHVTCVIDAQRQEFYIAEYDLGANPPRAVAPLNIESLSRVKERTSRGELLIGPEVSVPGNRPVFSEAAILAALAQERSDFLPGEKLEPIYLRETTFLKAPPPRLASAAS
jgi:tRNA threonylcarbamoyladenosine biosynthesis protein TsaB